MIEFVTPQGREIIKEITEDYPILWEFYQIELGNFTMSLYEYEKVKSHIDRWLNNHSEYVLELIDEIDEIPFYALYDRNDF